MKKTNSDTPSPPPVKQRAGPILRTLPVKGGNPINAVTRVASAASEAAHPLNAVQKVASAQPLKAVSKVASVAADAGKNMPDAVKAMPSAIKEASKPLNAVPGAAINAASKTAATASKTATKAMQAAPGVATNLASNAVNAVPSALNAVPNALHVVKDIQKNLPHQLKDIHNPLPKDLHLPHGMKLHNPLKKDGQGSKQSKDVERKRSSSKERKALQAPPAPLIPQPPPALTVREPNKGWFGGMFSDGCWCGKVPAEAKLVADDLSHLSPDEQNLQIALASLKKGIRLLDGLDLNYEGDIGMAQLKGGLRLVEESISSPEVVVATGSKGGNDTKKNLKDLIPKELLEQVMSIAPGGVAPALNSIASVMWPRINEYFEQQVHWTIEPLIDAALPTMFAGSVKFTKASLGNSTPCFGPLDVDYDEESGEVEISIGVQFSSNIDVELAACAVRIGITKMSLEGTLVVILAPATMEPPFFGGVQVFFPNPPEVRINFVGAARVANIPGLRGAVRTAIANCIAGACVLPQRIAVDLDERDDVDVAALKFPDPTHILRVTLLSATNLVAADLNILRSATSDPYVTATLGCKTWTSSWLKKTLNPVWGKGEGEVVDFPVHSHRQNLILKVYDHDFASNDDVIGIAQPMSLEAMSGGEGVTMQKEVPLETEAGTSAGSLTIKTSLLSLTTDRSAARMQGPSVAHLCVKIENGYVRLFGKGLKHPYTVTVRVLKAPPSHDHHAAPSEEGNHGHNAAHAVGLARSLLKNHLPNLNYEPEKAAVAEGTTGPSQHQPEQTFTQALEHICSHLAARGNTFEEIAKIMEVDATQVEHFLASQSSSADKKKHAKEAYEKQAATRPCFMEVVRMLLPELEDHFVLQLMMKDKDDKVHGTLEVPALSVLESDDLCLHGPFQLGEDVKLDGCIWIRWLT